MDGEGGRAVARAPKTVQTPGSRESARLRPPGPPQPSPADRTGRLEAAGVCPLTAQEPRGPHARRGPGRLPRSPLRAPVPAPGGSGLGVPRLVEGSPGLCLLCLCATSPPLKRTPVLGLRARLIQCDLVLTLLLQRPYSPIRNHLLRYHVGESGGHYPTQGNTFIPPHFQDAWILLL